MTSSRRKARGAALQVLYEIDLTGHNHEQAVDSLLEGAALSGENIIFVKDLVKGVLVSKSQLDEYIHRFAPAWPLAQLAVGDRNILRLSIYELLYVKSTPVKVAINEAVELAKAFGSDSSPKFVNGVLSSVNSSLSKTVSNSPEDILE